MSDCTRMIGGSRWLVQEAVQNDRWLANFANVFVENYKLWPHLMWRNTFSIRCIYIYIYMVSSILQSNKLAIVLDSLWISLDCWLWRWFGDSDYWPLGLKMRGIRNCIKMMIYLQVVTLGLAPSCLCGRAISGRGASRTSHWRCRLLWAFPDPRNIWSHAHWHAFQHPYAFERFYIWWFNWSC